MAKIKFGMMMTDARGKLGGQVFSKNRAGAYVRTKVTPVNPRTSFQQASRQLLGVISQSWSTITVEQRESFNKAVSDWARTDIFGDLKNPTGKNLFTRLNKNAIGAGFPFIITAPAKMEVPVIENFSIVFNSSSSVFIVNGLDALAEGTFQVSITPSLTFGTSFIKNRLRVLGYGTSGLDVVSLLTAGYSQRFGAIGSNANIWAQIVVVLPNGQMGVPVSVKVTVL